MIQVIVDGVILTEIKSARVNRTISAASGSFAVQIPHNVNQHRSISIELGKKVEIEIDGKVVINGYIENISTSYEKGSHALNFSGRDRTADFIDSSIRSAFEITTPITLAALIRATLANMELTDIKVIDEVNPDPFSEEFEITAEIGQTGFDFIEPFTRVKQVLITTDGAGNLKIVRAGTDYSGGGLINRVNEKENKENNIISASYSISDVERFNAYIVKSQEVFSAEKVESAPDDGTDIQGIATDPEIRKARVIIFEAEENVDAKGAGERAGWEANLRRARATSLSVKVQGHSAGKLVYSPNQLINILDDFTTHSEMLIESVESTFDIGSGSLTSLTLVPKDSYTIGLELAAKQARIDILADDF